MLLYYGTLMCSIFALDCCDGLDNSLSPGIIWSRQYVKDKNCSRRNPHEDVYGKTIYY